MKRARNIEGLQRSTVERRSRALERAEKTLNEMVQEKAKINVSSVAKRAGVSRTWLYAEPDLVARILHLRGQETTHIDLPPSNERPSNESLKAKILAQQQRIHKLTGENEMLRKRLEILGGLVYKDTLS